VPTMLPPAADGVEPGTVGEIGEETADPQPDMSSLGEAKTRDEATVAVLAERGLGPGEVIPACVYGPADGERPPATLSRATQTSSPRVSMGWRRARRSACSFRRWTGAG